VNKPIYALILDDHPMVSRGIAQYLKTLDVLDAVHTVSTAQQGLGLLGQLGGAKIAIVDFWLADGTSLGFIKHLQSHWPDTLVLVISGDTSPEVQAQAQKAGARGFIDKQASADTLGQAILALLVGMTWFQAEPSSGYNANRTHELPVSAIEMGLSSRQGQILALMLEGLPNKRIAQRLSVSESTIKEHITGILHKLGVGNRVEAITKLRGRRLVIE
jgi:DNA-binding NarL/FixJ family response regulator